MNTIFGKLVLSSLFLLGVLICISCAFLFCAFLFFDILGLADPGQIALPGLANPKMVKTHLGTTPFI